MSYSMTMPPANGKENVALICSVFMLEAVNLPLSVAKRFGVMTPVTIVSYEKGYMDGTFHVLSGNAARNTRNGTKVPDLFGHLKQLATNRHFRNNMVRIFFPSAQQAESFRTKMPDILAACDVPGKRNVAIRSLQACLRARRAIWETFPEIKPATP